MTDRERIYQALDSLGVAYERYAHAPAFHIDQCEALAARFHALICKNYFLSTRRKKDYCLCIVRPNARLRTSDISAQAGTSRLGFGSEEDLQAILEQIANTGSQMLELLESKTDTLNKINQEIGLQNA